MRKRESKHKIRKRKRITKIRAGINEIKNRKVIEKVNKTKSLFFEKINTIDKTLDRLMKKKEIGLDYIKS